MMNQLSSKMRDLTDDRLCGTLYAGGGKGGTAVKKRRGLYSMHPRDYFEKPRRQDASAAVTDAANELRRRLTEYSQYVTVSIYLRRVESLTFRELASFAPPFLCRDIGYAFRV